MPPGGGMDQNVDLDLDLDLRSEFLKSASNGGEWRARRQARCPAKPASLAGAVDCMERARDPGGCGAQIAFIKKIVV